MHAAMIHQETTMQPPDDYRCGACRFFEPRKGFVGTGWCKRHAPMPAFIRDDEEWIVAWPATDSDNWCGEWVSAEGGPA